MIRLASPIPAIALLAACSPQPPPCDTDELSIDGELCFGPVESALAVVEEFPNLNPGRFAGVSFRYAYLVASPVRGYCDTLRAAHAAIEDRLDGLLGGEATGDVACEDAAATYREAAALTEAILGTHTTRLEIELVRNGSPTRLLRSQTWWTEEHSDESGISERVRLDLSSGVPNRFSALADSLECSGLGTGLVRGWDRGALREGLGPWFASAQGDDQPVDVTFEPSGMTVGGLVAEELRLREVRGDEERELELSFDLTVEECFIDHRYDFRTFSFHMDDPKWFGYSNRP